MSEETSSYRQIFKATSIYGGVQVFNILISIVRSKFIAVLLGPAGMGIAGLLTTTISLLSSVTNFGLGVSSIKDIASVHERNDRKELLRLSSTVNTLVRFTGILGMILTLILSPFLSKLTFDSYDYTWSFVLLSITLFFSQLTLGKNAVLQGMRQVKWLAYANVIGSAVALIVTIPLYFLYGTDGIVPALIVMSCTTLVITHVFYKKLNLKSPTITFKESWTRGRPMLILGFYLSLSGLIATGCSYFVRIYITRIGGLTDVGFYNAGFGIINSYVGLIFTAMATDYYPRLAGAINDKSKYIAIVNQQGNVALMILGPILTVFIVFINVAVILLYSKEFLPINAMLQYAILGVFFKAASWLLGFVVLAKGSTKLFFWCELIANIYITILNCVGYYLWGIDGLGLSFIAGYILYLAQMLYVSKRFYGFYFDSSFLKIFAVQVAIAVLAFCSMKFVANSIISYSLGALLIGATSLYSLYYMNKIVNLRGLISKIKNK